MKESRTRIDGAIPCFYSLRYLLAYMLLLAGLGLATTAHAFGSSRCAAQRFGSNMNCTAGDVSVTNITPVAGSYLPYCVGGGTLTLDLNVSVQFGSSNRYAIGVFLANDGKTPKLLPGSGGASSCSVASLPTSSPFKSLDGDACGDGGGGLTDSFTMYGVQLPCTTDGSGNTTLYAPYVVTWALSSDALSGTCTGANDVTASNTSKCSSSQVNFTGVSIVVLPAITVADAASKTTVRTNAPVSYSIVISNSTGSVVSGAVFKDPAVANLAISGVSCASAGGATCPASLSVAALQDAGIALASMPVNSTLTFTVTGTYVGTPTSPTTLTNTASVSASGQTAPASYTHTVMVPPIVSKSFSSITSGGVSTLAITLTNPTTTDDITGAALTDLYPYGMTNNAVSPTVSNCGPDAVATTSTSPESLRLTGATIPKGGTCTVTASVTATATAINSTGDVISSNAATGTSASAMITVPGSPRLDALETSTPAANILNGRIYTKLAATSFNLDLVAIVGSSQATGFSGDVKVELLANTTSAGDCLTSSSVIQTISSAPISGGRSTVGFSAVPNAYRDVRVRISYPAAAATPIVMCSTDGFAIRPTSLTLSHNLGGPATVAAGTLFTLTATSSAPGYAGTPDLYPSRMLFSNTSGGASAALGPDMLTNDTGDTITDSTNNRFAAAGVSPTFRVLYHDVGYLAFPSGAVSDTTFTAIDSGSGDCVAGSASNVLASGKCGCEIWDASALAIASRFRPDHYEVTHATTPGNAGGFTYMDDDNLVLAISVTAFSAGGKIPTRYGAGYPNPSLATVSVSGMATDPITSALTDYSSRLASPALVTSPSWATGAATINDTFRFDGRSATTPVRDGPYEDFRLRLRINDPDGVQITRVNGTVVVATSSADSDPTRIRYGRLWLGNAFGTDRLPLSVPVMAQYWTANGWLRNGLDSSEFLTTLSGTNSSAYSPAAHPSNTPTSACYGSCASETAAFSPATSSGWADVAGTLLVGNVTSPSGTPSPILATSSVPTFPARLPDSTKLASGELTLTMGAPSGRPGSFDLTFVVPPWLQISGAHPKAKVAFGIYKGSNRFIYRREVR
jgi:hypothetical protein